MPKNVIVTDKADLESVAVPTDVVSHKYVMNEMAKELAANNLTIKKEVYHRNLNGEVATGTYILDYPGAKDGVDLMLSWTNTYDRTMRFNVVVGGYVSSEDAYILGDDVNPVKINQLNKPEPKALTTIKHAIASAPAEYNGILNNLAEMDKYFFDDDELAKMMGILYFKEDALTSSQLIKVKDALKDSVDNLKDIYLKTASMLNSSHPKSWVRQQRDLHCTVMLEISRIQPLLLSETKEQSGEAVDPNQISLLDQIAETEAEVPVDQEPLNLDDYGNDPKEPKEEPLLEDTVTINTTYHKAADLMGGVPNKLPDDLNGSDADEDDNKEQDPEALTLEAHNPEPELPTPPANLPVAESNQTVEDTEETVNEVMDAEEPCETAEELLGDKQPEEETAQPAIQEQLDKIDNEPAIPLEQQVAGETVQPVSEEEIAVSLPPVVDEPQVVKTSVPEGKEFNTSYPIQELTDDDKEETPVKDPELDFLEEGPTEDPVFSPAPELEEQPQENTSNATTESPFEF